MTAFHAFALDTTSAQIDWICPDVTEKDILPNLTQVKVSEKWEISIRWLHHVFAILYDDTSIHDIRLPRSRSFCGSDLRLTLF